MVSTDDGTLLVIIGESGGRETLSAFGAKDIYFSL